MTITIANLFGMALGPKVAGMLSDKYDLQTALLIASCLPFLVALGYALAENAYERAPGQALGRRSSMRPRPGNSGIGSNAAAYRQDGERLQPVLGSRHHAEASG